MNKVFHKKSFQIHSSTIECIFLMREQRLITSSYKYDLFSKYD